jgi:hypothetical protein
MWFGCARTPSISILDDDAIGVPRSAIAPWTHDTIKNASGVIRVAAGPLSRFSKGQPCLSYACVLHLRTAES